ncbi:DUF6157 family protein [Brevibacterium daeguense]|uniref:DUF6157 family protein n=1 Tax=Brevibacterium daeguense TaxID=909936 RepID=A0ABP8EKV8_9MICO|nr:DUF6157 family protein [Brevibacterium daeguense]
MAQHTTNYFSTLITVAPDSTAATARVPKTGAGGPSVAAQQFALISEHPYQLTSDDVIFTVWADRAGIAEPEREAARQQFFSKGQACLRASPLPKTHGFGIHSDRNGRVALVPMDSPRYDELAADDTVTKKPAMRSRRKQGGSADG